MKHPEITEKVIGAFNRVYNSLGWGFLERVYKAALLHELGKCGVKVDTEWPFTVYYDGVSVGEYFCDLLVEEKVILELKSAEQISPAHEAQLLNYLKASSIEVGLLLNFGPKPQFKRKVFETARYRNTSYSPSSPSDPGAADDNIDP